jgi:hypothetical protein
MSRAVVRLGKWEREVLGMCELEGWRAPYGLLQGYPGKQVKSLGAKGLLVTRWGLMSADQRSRYMDFVPADADSVRYLGEARLTEKGRGVAGPFIAARKKRDEELARRVASWEVERAWERLEDSVAAVDLSVEEAWKAVGRMREITEEVMNGNPFAWNPHPDDVPF